MSRSNSRPSQSFFHHQPVVNLSPVDGLTASRTHDGTPCQRKIQTIREWAGAQPQEAYLTVQLGDTSHAVSILDMSVNEAGTHACVQIDPEIAHVLGLIDEATLESESQVFIDYDLARSAPAIDRRWN